MSTIKERLDMIAALPEPWFLIFDGCHKIYVAQSEDDRDDAFGNGYGVADFHPVSYIHDLWALTCALRFVHQWNLEETPAWNIDQCEEDI